MKLVILVPGRLLAVTGRLMEAVPGRELSSYLTAVPGREAFPEAMVMALADLEGCSSGPGPVRESFAVAVVGPPGTLGAASGMGDALRELPAAFAVFLAAAVRDCALLSSMLSMKDFMAQPSSTT